LVLFKMIFFLYFKVKISLYYMQHLKIHFNKIQYLKNFFLYIYNFIIIIIIIIFKCYLINIIFLFM